MTRARTCPVTLPDGRDDPDRTEGAVHGATRHVAHSRWGERGARVGLAARGVVFLLFAYLIVRVALGALGRPGTATPASLTGVGQSLDRQGGGDVVLCLLAAGLVLYALFSVIDTVLHHDDEGPAAKRWGDRLLSAWGAVLYLGLAGYCLVIAVSTRSGQTSAHDRSRKRRLSAAILRAPDGSWWLGLIGAALAVTALFLVVRAARRSFRPRLDRERMQPRVWRLANVLGTIGYLGRAGLFGLAGGCVLAAAIENRPRYGQGVNGAARVVANSTVGPAALAALAFALVCYAGYMAVEARYRHV